jgi:hypothetical protein
VGSAASVYGSFGIARLAVCRAVRAAGRSGGVATEVDDLLAHAGVRCEYAVVTVAVDARRRGQAV